MFKGFESGKGYKSKVSQHIQRHTMESGMQHAHREK